MRYICMECGHVFNEDDFASVSEDRGFVGNARAYEGIAVCPQCHSDEYEEAYECCLCHEELADENIQYRTEQGDAVCKDCYINILIKFNLFKNKVRELFEEEFPDETERAVIESAVRDGEFEIDD